MTKPYFKLLGKKLPKDLYVAFSGGSDSVCFTHFLLTLGFKITLLHFNHNISLDDELAYNFTKSFAKEYSLELITDHLNKPNNEKYSPEEYQRVYRYIFLEKFNDKPILMCHTLNDNMETWLFSSINGQSKLIPYRNKNIIRPFMLNSKQLVEKYLKENNLNYYLDSTNFNLNLPRNFIRHNLMTEIFKINKGFDSMISKLILKKYKREFENY